MSAAFSPDHPAADHDDRAPAATPGDAADQQPGPPSGSCRKYAPAWAASRPAISLIGASSGSRPSAVSTVS